MKFPHIVNYNGVRYPAGAEVPIGYSSRKEPEPPKVEKPKPPTKREVTLMRKADLVALAERNGIRNADIFSAAALREQLIEMFDL